MPTLLSPAALWALAALALPLALHLWRPPPRTVQLPSLRFLQSTARQPLRNLRWRERLLLAARLLLLTLLVLLLARLAWQPPAPTRPARWILLDPAARPSGASLDRLRALRRSGCETHQLAPGLPPAASTTNPNAVPPDVWSVLREADAALPPGSSVAVFSPGYLASLRGLRPALGNARVEWVQTPLPLPFPSLLPTSHFPLPTSTILLLHDAEHAEDARHLAAALNAVSKTTTRPLDIQVSALPHPASRIPHPSAWTFWLCSDAPPPDLAAHTANLFTVAAGPPADAAPSVILPAPGIPGADAFVAPVRLWRRTDPAPGAVVWTDGFGVPLLTQTRADGPGPMRWHLASRFHPDWNELPDTTALPAFVRALLASGDAPPTADERLADPSQGQPSDIFAAPVPAALPPVRDLSQTLLLLIAAVFAVERILSHFRHPFVISTPSR